jgi:hypothetical protein
MFTMAAVPLMLGAASLLGGRCALVRFRARRG